MIYRLIRSRKLKLILLVFGIDLLFFGFVNPVSGHSYVAIVGSLLLAISIYIMLRLIVMLFSVFFPISQRSQNRLGVFLSLVAVFLLLMQSVGQLSARDVLAVVPLMLISYLYIGYSPDKAAKTD